MTAVLRFGDLEIDEALYELRIHGEIVRLEPKAFDTVLTLAKNCERVVTKEELLDELWPGASSDAIVARYIADARRALGDSASHQRYIKTVHGRGYRLVAAPTPSTAGAPLPAPDKSAYVGRSDLIAEIDRLLAEAAAGSGRVVLLAGEPGIGKTRTATDAALRAAARGALVLSGRGYEREGAPPLWPWVQVLREALGTNAGLAALSDLGRARADLAALVPDEVDAAGPAAPDAASEARFRQFDATTAFLRGVAARTPIVVLLDDVHWADTSSLLLLSFVAREIRSTAVAIVATHRNDPRSEEGSLRRVLGELSREPVTHRFALHGLSAADIHAHLESVSEGPVPPDVVSLLESITDGNPFHLEETARLLANERALGSPAMAKEHLRLPVGLRDALLARLARLSEECNAILGAAAVLGRRFSPTIVARISASTAEQVIDALDEAAASGITRGSELGAHEFSHALVCDVAYDRLPAGERSRLHAAAGAAIADAHAADLEPHLADLAHHYSRAIPHAGPERAIHYSHRAAERANRMLAYEAARTWYERTIEGMDLATPVDEAARSAALIDLAHALVNSGDRQAARTKFVGAARAAERLSRSDLVARAALGLGGQEDFFGTPRDVVLTELLEKARAGLDPERDPGLLAGVLGRLASVEPYADSLGERRELSAQAVELARQTRDPQMLARTLAARLWASLGPDHVDEQIAIGEELLALGRGAGGESVTLVGHEFMFAPLLANAKLTEADHHAEAIARIALDAHRPMAAWVAEWLRSSRALSDGRFVEAKALIEASFGTGSSVEHPSAAVLYGAQLFWLAFERGDAASFAAGIAALEPDYRWAAGISPVAAAYAAAERGDANAAERALSEIARSGFDAIPRNEHWHVVMTVLARTIALVGGGAREHAADLAKLLEPFEDRLAVHDLLRVHAGCVSHELGLLAQTLDDRTRASHHFEHALEVHVRIGAAPAEGRTREAWAAHILREAPARARELALEARAIAERVGMPALAARAAKTEARTRSAKR